METASFNSELSSTSTPIDLGETDMMEKEPRGDDGDVDKDKQRNMSLHPFETSKSRERRLATPHAGNTGSDSEDENPRDIESGQTGEKQYEVQWDGDLDPGNPKSMQKARKWLIVLIVSSCSLCV